MIVNCFMKQLLPTPVLNSLLGRGKGNNGVKAFATYAYAWLPPRVASTGVVDGGFHVYEQCRPSENYPRGRRTWVYCNTKDEAKFILTVIKQRQAQLRGLSV